MGTEAVLDKKELCLQLIFLKDKLDELHRYRFRKSQSSSE